MDDKIPDSVAIHLLYPATLTTGFFISSWLMIQLRWKINQFLIHSFANWWKIRLSRRQKYLSQRVGHLLVLLYNCCFKRSSTHWLTRPHKTVQATVCACNFILNDDFIQIILQSNTRWFYSTEGYPFFSGYLVDKMWHLCNKWCCLSARQVK